MQRKINWTAVGLGVLMVGAIGAPFIANDISEDNANSIEDLATKMTALDEKIDAGLTIDVNLEEGSLTQEIRDKLFEDDAWESEAEILALEELEDDDYEELYDYMTDDTPGGLGLKIDDEDDIDKVIIKDVKYSDNMDADDKYGTVELELKIYYENSDGDDKKVTIDATAIIEDGEVEDLSFN